MIIAVRPVHCRDETLARDVVISTKIKARIVGDRELKSSRVDIAVIAGHAQAVEGVVDVTPFIQLTSQ